MERVGEGQARATAAGDRLARTQPPAASAAAADVRLLQSPIAILRPGSVCCGWRLEYKDVFVRRDGKLAAALSTTRRSSDVDLDVCFRLILASTPSLQCITETRAEIESQVGR